MPGNGSSFSVLPGAWDLMCFTDDRRDSAQISSSRSSTDDGQFSSLSESSGRFSPAVRDDSPTAIWQPNHNSNAANQTRMSAIKESIEESDYGDPGPMDVISGRGGLVNNSSGNKRYLKIVNECGEEYAKAEKSKKQSVVKKVISKVKEGGGHFVVFDKKAKCFRKLSKKKMRGKVSQALRESKTFKAAYPDYLRAIGADTKTPLTRVSEQALDRQPKKAPRTITVNSKPNLPFPDPGHTNNAMRESASIEAAGAEGLTVGDTNHFDQRSTGDDPVDFPPEVDSTRFSLCEWVEHRVESRLAETSFPHILKILEQPGDSLDGDYLDMEEKLYALDAQLRQMKYHLPE